ncbi:MEKHLA domain-containing protein [Sphingomonas sp. LB-2]|uniref:MEKHLA domain-containing protein n=1 Tax=Sphingomonas caeni TaxID=2984949 RepID=UPI00222FF3C9|nr:MEKHLA domain-containing protein [Sphingomonas caeni]MCW3847155.1 MEKHLA domain-containing protein [Sphingomonas caeni]
MIPPRFTAPEMRARLTLIAASYRRLTGRDLIPAGADPVESLWTAPRIILAHGTEPDPIFLFGNRAALDRFGMTLDAFTAMPSRLSAEPLHRDERQALLDRVARHGFIDDYSGIRIAADGRRFRVEGATVWNLIDAEGALHGQAATFDRWTDLA